MFAESAELYDLIYGAFKDYTAEPQRIAALLRERHPAARTVLDVGCGTGEHARLLTEAYGFRVDGIDLEPGLIEIAREKSPAGRFEQADMLDFDLGTRYDAVVCLFSTIGYAKTRDYVQRALTRFRQHLADGGIVVVEPWLTPEVVRDGTVFMHTAETDNLKVCRMSRTQLDGRMTRLHFEYLIGRPGQVERANEVHELGLFTVEEMREAFRASGLAAEHDPEGLTGRGLYVARAADGVQGTREGGLAF
jgi:SAM-dependent methyltransferase